MKKEGAGERQCRWDIPVKLGAADMGELTRREMDVLCRLVHGKTDVEIASELNLSVSTVKQHIQRLREKTHFRNRTELAVQAALSGIVFKYF